MKESVNLLFMSKNNKRGKKDSQVKWLLIVLIMTFALSMFFSFIGSLIPLNGCKGTTFFAIRQTFRLFFHAMASKKVKGSKMAIKLIRSAPKVSNFCNDVIGDICGVLSGAISAILTIKITNNFGLSTNIQFIMSALVASLTVGGKALGKEFAKRKCNSIIYGVAKILSL